MKKFLLIGAFVFPCTMFANHEILDTTETVESRSVNNTVLATLNISVDELTRPWVISVPAPPSAVRSIVGPCAANYASWTVSNGTLTISYARDNGYLDMYDGGSFSIRVYTSSQVYEIIVNVSM